MGSLHDPERCPNCQGRGRVVESRHEGNYRRRRKKCDVCAFSWSTYESVLNVQPVISKVEKRRAAEPAPPPASAPPAAPPPPASPSPVTSAPRGRRVTRSSYLSGS